jgi:putative aldouronate transport system substrate-binding protein
MKIKKKLTAIISAIMVITLCLSMFTGCTNKTKDDNSSKTEGNNSSGNDNASSGKEKLVLNITLEGNEGVKDSKVNDAFEKLMSEKLGREIELNYTLIPGSEYGDKAKLMLTTGDFGDIIQLPFLYDYSKPASEGFFLDVNTYKDSVPNFFGLVEKTSAGVAGIMNSTGNIYAIPGVELPRFPEDKGMLPSNVSTYRYDVFEKLGIKIPETLDEVYEAAKKIKEAYPDSYPINSRWKDLRSIYMANHVQNAVYWNGSEYVLGLLEEGYKESIDFAHKLYAEELLDPEYIIETDDTLKSKELTNKTFIVLGDWFTTPGEFTRLSTEGQVFCATLFPDNPKYGKAWQFAQKVNEVSINIFENYAISSKVKDPEGVMEFINHLYDDDVVRLLTWGIEGESYTLDENSNPKFVDEIMNAENPWDAGDKFGMRASRNMRPGFQLVSDTKAYVALAADDSLYYDGALHVEPFEQSPYYLNMPYPENEYIPPFFNEPILQFTDEEAQEKSQMLTAVETYRDEMQAKFVTGEMSMDEWNSYMDGIKGIIDVDRLLQIYNDAAKRYFENQK